METQRDIARYWGLNLLAVLAGYLGLILWLVASWYLVARALYPAGLALFEPPRGAPKPPEQSGFQFPWQASWSFIVLNLIGGAVVGYALTCFRRQRPTIHANMLAIIVFATFLQAALEPNGVFPKWIIAVLMSGEALAIVAGSQLAARGHA